MQIEKAIGRLSLCLLISLPLLSCGRRSQLETPERVATPAKRLPSQQSGANATEELDLDGVRGQKKSFFLDALL